MEWLENMMRKYQAAIANMFILHFNVTDLVDGSCPVEDFLLRSPILNNRDIVVKYNRSSGITFPRDFRSQETESDEVGQETPLEESEARAIWGLDSDIPIPPEPGQALYLIEKLLRQRRETPDGQVEARTALIIDFAETLIPNAEISQMNSEDRTILTTFLRWARDPELIQLGPPIILITENLMDIHSALRSPSAQIETIQIPLPDYQKRLEYIRKLMNSERFRDTVSMEITSEEMARLTAMLKLIHIEDIFLRAEDTLQPLNADLVKERKKEILAGEFREVLEDPDLEPYSMEMVGGLDHAIKFFRKNVIEPIKKNNLKRVPKGILLCGPSGTGKTLLVRAVAKEAGINNVDLNLAKITDKWVGSSEKNLEKALSCIKALAPVIVTIDEIDQLGLARESSDNTGVSNRIFRRLLEFMSDPKLRGQVIFVGLTNRPDLMDPALKRPGRFDKKIPILVPDKNDRIKIIEALMNRYNIKSKLTKKNLDKAGSATEEYTGAELEALILKASEVAEDSGSNEIKWKHFEHALRSYRPTTQDIRKMTQLALDECNDLDLLPPEWREKIQKETQSRKITYVPRSRRG